AAHVVGFQGDAFRAADLEHASHHGEWRGVAGVGRARAADAGGPAAGGFVVLGTGGLVIDVSGRHAALAGENLSTPEARTVRLGLEEQIAALEGRIVDDRLRVPADVA